MLKKYPELTEEIQLLADADLTKGKQKYLQWAINRVDGGDYVEDILEALESFHEAQKLLEEKDLNRYKTLEEVLEKSEEALQAEEDARDPELVYTKDGVRIYRIYTKAQMCEIGEGSDWCTAHVGGTYWDKEYTNKPGWEFYVIEEAGKKYLAYIVNGELRELRDWANKETTELEDTLYTAGILKSALKEDWPKWLQNAETVNARVVIDDYGDVVWISGTWVSGVWVAGTWKSGVWKSGVWETGTWDSGLWISGTWESGWWSSGEWRTGTWHQGVWALGTWKAGTWKNGVWERGTWENGTWENGTWKRGAWLAGVWENGAWKSGNWYDGVWKNGTWETGTWRGGTWIDGVWRNGIWENGLWYDGAWEYGTWEYGVWRGGAWKDGVWKAGTWIDGVWHEGAWKSGIWEKGEQQLDGKWVETTDPPTEEPSMTTKIMDQLGAR